MSEIIIDGCNVSECMYYKDFSARCDIAHNLIGEYAQRCKTYSSCYFKELQRAKAELEQYKKDIKDGVGCIQCKKELENDTLHITIEKLKADLSQAETSLYAWKAENEKLKQALIDIKVDFINHNARNGITKFENEIFLKISEVLNESH